MNQLQESAQDPKPELQLPPPPERGLRALLLYVSWQGNGAAVAQRLGDRLREKLPAGSRVLVRDFMEEYGDEWRDCWRRDISHGLDICVIGGSVHGQLYSPGFVASMLSSNPGIGRFLTDERVRSTLDRIPVVAFWSVGITPVLLHKTASSGVESVDSANSRALEVLKSYLQDTLGYPVDDTEREYLPGPYIPPHLLRAFPGALMWTRMPWYMRIPAHLGLGVEQVEMAEESEKRGEKVVGVWVGEAPLDVKKDYVWTDWDEVDAYAGAIVREAAERGQVRG